MFSRSLIVQQSKLLQLLVVQATPPTERGGRASAARSQPAAGPRLSALLRAHGDGQLDHLGSLRAPQKDGAEATAGHQSEQVLAAGEPSSSPLEKLGLQAVVPPLVVLAVQVPAANGVLQVLKVKVGGKKVGGGALICELP
jgi:hypothetical protein